MSWIGRGLRGAAAGLTVLFACALAARLSDLGPWTLGLLSERLGGAVMAGAVATLFGVMAWRRHGGLLGSAAVLVATYGFDADVTRRRSALFALLCLGIPWALHAALDRGRERTFPWIVCAVLAGAGLGSVVAADRLPYRTELPSISAAAPPPDAPHIVLITMDTTRYDAVIGSAAAPALARFAKTALSFPQTIAEASHTHPSMASLVTSRMPLEHGSMATSPAINPALPTLAAHLRRSGYRTAGFLENPWLGPDFGLADGYEYLHRKAQRTRIDAWLDGRKDRPLFLHVHLFEPHGPYELRKSYLPQGPLAPWREAANQLGEVISAEFIRAGEEPGAHDFGPEGFEWLQRIYLTEVGAMDEWIRDFIEHTERTLGSHTIFVVTADHGEEFGDHGGLHHGHTLHAELVHVPLLVRVPGVAPGTRSVPAGLVDVAPTILDAAGLTPLPNAAGRSLLAEELSALPLVSTRFFKDGEHLFSIQSGEWKLVLRTDADVALDGQPIDFVREALSGSLQLYRWADDPGELRNVVHEHKDVVQRLQAELGDWHARALGRSLRDPLPGPSDSSARRPSQATYQLLRSLGYSGVAPGSK